MSQWSITFSAFLLGAIGWVAAEFIGRPFRDFMSLRREIRRQDVFLANIGPLDATDPFDDSITAFQENAELVAAAAKTLRDLGSQAIAFDQTEWLAARVARWFGILPMPAGRALIGLANSLENPQEAEEQRTIISHALRFDRMDEFDWKHAPE